MENIMKFEFEVATVKKETTLSEKETIDINAKYESGNSRVVTEIGSYKVALIKDVFSQPNYNLHPEYQRRITWDRKKRSKLIESLIINIPIPPIFLYEYDYDKYEVMDGLQRLTAIMDFYNNEYKLSGLEEWKELDGKKYKDLPEKIKEGIDRRQLQVITLLKETASTLDRADKIKRLLFERLNTGGVKLMPQEVRNAIFNGPGNDLCLKLSNNSDFKKLWDIPVVTAQSDNEILDEEQYEFDDEKMKKKLERHALYKRMYDVELVLRFFAMRYVNDFEYALADFLDDNLVVLNKYTSEQLTALENLFNSAIDKAYKLFGDKAFRLYIDGKWSAPTRMIYDPLMVVLAQTNLELGNTNQPNNIAHLEKFYEKHISADNNAFDGKHQSKENIKARMVLFKEFLEELTNE